MFSVDKETTALVKTLMTQYADLPNRSSKLPMRVVRIESRVPYLDQEFVDHILSLPEDAFEEIFTSTEGKIIVATFSSMSEGVDTPTLSIEIRLSASTNRSAAAGTVVATANGAGGAVTLTNAGNDFGTIGGGATGAFTVRAMGVWMTAMNYGRPEQSRARDARKRHVMFLKCLGF